MNRVPHPMLTLFKQVVSLLKLETGTHVFKNL